MAERLEIEFLAEAQISEGLKKQINDLDHEAFFALELHKDDELAKIEWASSEWMALGFIEEQLVTQLCLTDRKINVGETSFHVAGIGGVATLRNWQNQGFASQLLKRAENFMKIRMKAPFGLLVCDDKLREFYAQNEWKKIAESLWFTQAGQRNKLKTTVMIIALEGEEWPSGEIDLCGLPW